MQRLADDAGVGVRTLYRAYGSRDHLLAAAGCERAPTTRQRILEAGLESVGQSGLAGLSMDELAAMAGVSRATLYRLFPGKEALFDALVQTFSPWQPVADILAASSDGPPDQVIPAIAHAIADSLSGRAGMLLRIVLELGSYEPDTAAARHHALGQGLPDLVGYLERQMNAGRLRRVPALVACQLLAGPILAGQLTQPLAEAMEPHGPDPEEQLDQIVGAWQRAMAP
jgi:AcrR family transcriptional regulator